METETYSSLTLQDKPSKKQSPTPDFEYSGKLPCTGDELQTYQSILNNACLDPMAASWTDEKLSRSWDIFYKNNKTQAYRDRNWINDEFPELSKVDPASSRKKFLELGCGVGNSLFPVLSQNPHLDCGS